MPASLHAPEAALLGCYSCTQKYLITQSKMRWSCRYHHFSLSEDEVGETRCGWARRKAFVLWQELCTEHGGCLSECLTSAERKGLMKRLIPTGSKERYCQRCIYLCFWHI